MTESDTLTITAPSTYRQPHSPAKFAISDDPWRVVLTPSFLRQHTPFLDLNDLIGQCGVLPAEGGDDQVENEVMDAVIRQYTQFSCLTEFLRAALREWTRQHMTM